MWPCTGVGNCSVEGVSHTEVVQAPHVPPHTALELPMVQQCACLSHGIAGAGAASTSPTMMHGKGRQAGQPCNNALELSGATVQAAMELNGHIRMQNMYVFA